MLRKKDNVIIYLVDDNDFQLKLLQNKFKSSTNYTLHTFRNGETFLEYIIKNPQPKKAIGIVILDYFLSTDQKDNVKNGIEILKNINEIKPDFSVIMYSVSDDIDVATSAMHHGAINFIKKNENSFSRIHNTINWIISETNLKNKKKQSKLTIRLFFGFLVLIVVVGLALYLINPGIFTD